MTIEQLFCDHLKFTFKNFPEVTPDSSIIKLMDEAGEVIEELLYRPEVHSPALLEEYVDCFMALTDSMARAGFTFPEFKDAFEAKLRKNQGRKWRKNENGTYSHIKI